jgi:hypothetical protein
LLYSPYNFANNFLLKFLSNILSNYFLVFPSLLCYICLMSITQTVEVPASHRLTIDVPREVPAGTVILTFTPKTAVADEDGLDYEGECPICAAHRDPITGNPRYNAETVAAIEEGMAISRGEIPAKRFHSFEEMVEDLERDDPDDDD